MGGALPESDETRDPSRKLAVNPFIMATKFPSADDRRVYDAPLHVVRSGDGTVSIFFPDGHRMVLTADAAERSGAMLWRSGVAQRSQASRGRRRASGEVIAVDFSGRRQHA